MPKPDLEQEKTLQEKELRIWRQVAFASGLFQGDVTVRTLLESIAEGVIIMDSSGNILLVNNRAEQMFGYPYKDIVGKPHDILIPGRFREIHEEHQARYIAEPRIRPMGQLLNLIGLRQDGSEFPVEISLSFIETVNGTLFIAFVSDITLRKEFETRLRKSEELFHIQIERVKDYAIFTLDPKGNVLNWNAGAEHLKGYRGEEIIGKHFSYFYSEEDRRAGVPDEALRKAATEGQFVCEGWRFRKDGSRFWADVTLTALHDENGNLRGFSNVTHDISERKRADDALRLSEARYRTLYTDSPVMIITIDTDLTMHSVNPTCASQLGYAIGELEGQPVLKLFIEEDRPAVREQLQRCFQNTGEVYHWQFRKIRKDGVILWVEETAQAIYDLNNKLNVLVVCQDITERKGAEDALQESEARFHAIFSLAPIGMTISTLDEGRFVEINDTGERLSGYRRDEVIGRTSAEFSIWNDASERAEVIAEVLKTGKVRDREMAMKDKSGRVFWGSFSAVAIEMKGKQYLLSLVSDIAERKRAQEALRESAERFRLLADTVPVMIWETGPDACFTFLSKPWFEFTGRSLEREVGEVGDDLTQGVHPDDRGRWMDTYLSAFKDRRGFSTEYRLCRSDGEYRWIVNTGVPRLAPNGDLLGYVGTCFDITERKRVKEELEQEKELLAQRVAERTAELSRTVEKLQDEINERISIAQTLQAEISERLRAQAELRANEVLLLHQSRLAAMGEMIGNIAHQWRQPLNMLALLAQDLELTYKEGEFSAEYLEANVLKVVETINHMSQTIDDFRYFFRQDKEKADFRVLAMIEKTISLLEGSLKGEQIVTSVIPAGDPVVNGYPNEFCQVLLNIIMNARDAFVARKVPSPTITVEVGTEGDRCVVTITDNAGGIPEDIIARIFDPYFTTKGPDKGTGVGLFMSKIIIEKNMGGTLSACNVADGAQFRIEV